MVTVKVRFIVHYHSWEFCGWDTRDSLYSLGDTSMHFRMKTSATPTRTTVAAAAQTSNDGWNAYVLRYLWTVTKTMTITSTASLWKVWDIVRDFIVQTRNFGLNSNLFLFMQSWFDSCWYISSGIEKWNHYCHHGLILGEFCQWQYVWLYVCKV